MRNILTSLPAAGEPLTQQLSALRRIRRGTKISRFFRHIFEHTHIRKIVGSQLAILLIASSFVPVKAAFDENAVEEVVVETSNPSLKTERTVAFPVQNPVINQGYHFFHPAVDFEGVTGDPVNAIMKGEVINISYSRIGYGNAVLIKHENGLTSLYAHLSKITVVKGEKVDTFSIIGEIGATGRATGDHLHLEIRTLDGRPINPLTILPI